MQHISMVLKRFLKKNPSDNGRLRLGSTFWICTQVKTTCSEAAAFRRSANAGELVGVENPLDRAWVCAMTSSGVQVIRQLYDPKGRSMVWDGRRIQPERGGTLANSASQFGWFVLLPLRHARWGAERICRRSAPALVVLLRQICCSLLLRRRSTAGRGIPGDLRAVESDLCGPESAQPSTVHCITYIKSDKG